MNAFYFGTFNPVHLGHLLIAQSVLNQFDYDSVVFVPNRQAPLKDPAEMASAEDRCRMLELAVADNPAFAVDKLEQHREGISYTAQSLRQLPERYPALEGQQIPFIIGTDALAGLRKWRETRFVTQRCFFLQAPRPLHPPLKELTLDDETLKLHTELIHMPEVATSSTHIRALARQGKNLRYLVPDAVRDYIGLHEPWGRQS